METNGAFPARRCLLGRNVHGGHLAGRMSRRDSSLRHLRHVRSFPGRCKDESVTDRNWLAVHERVLRGLRDYDVLAHPPKDDLQLGYLAEVITDNVASGIELSREAKRATRKRHERPGHDQSTE